MKPLVLAVALHCVPATATAATTSATSTIAAKASNLTVYRITPRNYTGLTNMDSGDAAGDVYFGLYEFALPIICADQPDLVNCENIPIISIPGFNVYAKTTIEVDTRFAIYKGCNPNASTGIFSCTAWDTNCWDSNPHYRDEFSGVCSKDSCRCPAFDFRAVGKDTCNMCEQNATWHHHTQMWRQVEALGQKLNGTWFSTQADGECKPGQQVGVDCWWRIVRQVRNVNASCVSNRVLGAAMLHGQSCFDGCGADAHNTSSPCFIDCLFSVALANMTKEEIVAPFEQAFNSNNLSDGGCEEVPPCPPPCTPPVVTVGTVTHAVTRVHAPALPGPALRPAWSRH